MLNIFLVQIPLLQELLHIIAELPLLPSPGPLPPGPLAPGLPDSHPPCFLPRRGDYPYGYGAGAGGGDGEHGGGIAGAGQAVAVDEGDLGKVQGIVFRVCQNYAFAWLLIVLLIEKVNNLFNMSNKNNKHKKHLQNHFNLFLMIFLLLTNLVEKGESWLELVRTDFPNYLLSFHLLFMILGGCELLVYN